MRCKQDADHHTGEGCDLGTSGGARRLLRCKTPPPGGMEAPMRLTLPRDLPPHALAVRLLVAGCGGPAAAARSGVEVVEAGRAEAPEAEELTLVAEGHEIRGVNAICRLIAERTQPDLLGATPEERAEVRLAEEWARTLCSL